MRIAVVAPPWLPVPPPAYGGTEAVLHDLAGGLVALGHDVTLFCHPDSTTPVPRRSIVPVADTVPMGKATIELEHAIGAYAAASEFDVVSDHTIAGPVVAVGTPGCPVVATNHNAFNRPRQEVYAFARHRVGIVALSQAHASTTSLPVAAVIHHGIDVAGFPIGAGDGGYLAALTRMSPVKGVDRAARLARQAGLPLKIAAKLREPHEQEYFDRCVRPHLGGGVEYVGELDGDAKRELLGGATALLNPIEWDEPFGMTMLEAMACGTPVITTPRGAAVEIVEHGVTGFVADTDDDLIAGMRVAGALDRLRCRGTVATRFSVEAMCTKYVAAYEHRIAHDTGKARE